MHLFYRGTKLTRATGTTHLSETLRTGVKVIGTRAFADTAVEEIVLPDTVTEIEPYAFYRCHGMIRAELGNSVSVIGKYAFANCFSLRSLRLPESIREIGIGAFVDCRTLKSVIAPASLSDRTYSWWRERFGLETACRIGFENVGVCPKILAGTKGSWEDAASLIVKEGRTDWLQLLLDQWKPRVPTEILNQMQEFFQAAESGEMLSSLLEYRRKMYTRKDLERIEEIRLEKAMGLRPLSVKDWKRLYSFRVEETGEITLEKYIGDEETAYLPQRIGRRQVTAIAPGAFYQTKARAVVPDPDNEIFSFAENALYDKRTATLICYFGEAAEVTVPEGTRAIGEYAFACSELRKITLPTGLRSIGDFAFNACASLSCVLLPEGLEEIGYGAFRECSALGTLVIPDSTERIGMYAFSHCRSLTSLRLPAGLRETSEHMLQFCSALKELVLPEGLKKIGNYTLLRCVSLERLVLPKSLTVIGSCAFAGCLSLATLTLPRGLEEIGCRAFEGLSKTLTCVHFGGTAAEWERVKKPSDTILDSFRQTLVLDEDSR